jgi:hypothetical protein
VVEASEHVEILIPYGLYRKVLRFIRTHHLQARPDEVVADPVRAYLRSPLVQEGRILNPRAECAFELDSPSV